MQLADVVLQLSVHIVAVLEHRNVVARAVQHAVEPQDASMPRAESVDFVVRAGTHVAVKHI